MDPPWNLLESAGWSACIARRGGPARSCNGAIGLTAVPKTQLFSGSSDDGFAVGRDVEEISHAIEKALLICRIGKSGFREATGAVVDEVERQGLGAVGAGTTRALIAFVDLAGKLDSALDELRLFDFEAFLKSVAFPGG